MDILPNIDDYQKDDVDIYGNCIMDDEKLDAKCHVIGYGDCTGRTIWSDLLF